jgi:hypothetical protein
MVKFWRVSNLPGLAYPWCSKLANINTGHRAEAHFLLVIVQACKKNRNFSVLRKKNRDFPLGLFLQSVVKLKHKKTEQTDLQVHLDPAALHLKRNFYVSYHHHICNFKYIKKISCRICRVFTIHLYIEFNVPLSK